MAEYIEREALLADLRESYKELKKICEGLKYEEERQICSAELTTFVECILRVKNAPAADVVEVRYANITASNGFDEWAGTVFECGGCGCNWMTLENETNYCPNCGADMRGDNNGKK